MTDLPQRIDNSLPIGAQNIAVSAYGLVTRHRQSDGEFQRYFLELMDSQWFSKKEMSQLQRRKVRDHSRQTGI